MIVWNPKKKEKGFHLRALLSAFLWTIGFIVFIIVFLILVISLLLAPPAQVFKIVRVLFRIQLFVIGVRMAVSGYEKFDHEKSYLIMGNHESLIDAFVVPSALPKHFIAVEAEEHFRYPFWGYLTKKWGNIPITRKNTREAIKSIKRAQEKLNAGTSIIIMPEGTRTITGKIQNFKKGPFHLALSTNADILPFAMRGLFEFKNKSSWLLYPRKVYLRFGAPIPYNEYKNKSVEELRDFVRERIIHLKETS